MLQLMQNENKVKLLLYSLFHMGTEHAEGKKNKNKWKVAQILVAKFWQGDFGKEK